MTKNLKQDQTARAVSEQPGNPSGGKTVNTRNVTIVTSRDVEGLVCAAMIMHKEQMHCEVVLSDYISFWDDIELIATAARLPETLYVTNIDPRGASRDVLAKLTLSGTTMIWLNGQFDTEMYDDCYDMISDSPPLVPTSRLLAKRFGGNDLHYLNLACVSHPYGVVSLTSWHRDRHRLLLDNVLELDSGVLHRLAHEEDLTEDDFQAILAVQEWEKCKANLADQTREEIPVGDCECMIVYDLSAYNLSGLPGLYLQEELFSYSEAESCLIRISKDTWHLMFKQLSSLSLFVDEPDAILSASPVTLKITEIANYFCLKDVGSPSASDAYPWVLAYLSEHIEFS